LKETLKREIIEETGYLDFKIKNKITRAFYEFKDNSELVRKEINFYKVKLLSDKKQDISLTENERKKEMISK
jgi:hypothetical protein